MCGKQFHSAKATGAKYCSANCKVRALYRQKRFKEWQADQGALVQLLDGKTVKALKAKINGPASGA